MVEDELFPALRYFGLRFYAYNPVRIFVLSAVHSNQDSSSQPWQYFFLIHLHFNFNDFQ